MSERDAFVAARQARWERLEHLVGPGGARNAAQWAELASLYRSVCADLARAQALGLSDDVRAYLDQLAGRAHNQLYAVRKGGRWRVLDLIANAVPREVRRNWAFFLVASLLFYVPFAVGALGARMDPAFTYAILPEAMVAHMEASYSESIARGAEMDAQMAGFYVYNNVGIAFRCFATGALAGMGTIFFLVYNGLVIGTVAGHLFAVGHGANLVAFVSGHSAWELTGIVVAGAAGLRLGWAIVDTGGLTRLASLRRAAPSLFLLIVGAAVMLLVAAAIEGFWSGLDLPYVVKVAFGLVQVFLVAGWLLLGGRGSR